MSALLRVHPCQGVAKNSNLPTALVNPLNAPLSLFPSRRSTLLAATVIVLAAVAAYHNSFSGVLVFDDRTAITDNLSIRQWWPPGPALAPPAESGTGGRPLANLTFAVNYAISGFAVWSYHAFNLLIHGLAGLTLFGVVRRTLQQSPLRARFGDAARPLALAVATLWIVHPLQSGTVNYVSQRTELLMALGYLLTLYCFIRGAAQSDPIWLSLAVGACLLGMASKEVMVTAPVMVLLYDRTFIAGTIREAWRRRPLFYVALAATWLVLGWLMQDVTQRGIGYSGDVAWSDYALTECRAVVLYLKLAIWPHPLVFDYGTDWVRSASAAAPYALVLGPLLAGTWVAWWRWPALGFAGGAILVMLAPTSSVVPIIQQPMAESRMYLPLAAVVTLVVLGLHAWLGRRSLAVMLVLAGALGAATVQRNRLYASEETVWRDTVARRPQNTRALNNLASAIFKDGRIAEALPIWAEALRLRPDYADVHNNVGFALIRSNRVAEAVPHLQAALRLQPDFAEAHDNFGLALARLGGRQVEALAHYEEALRLKPGYVPAHNNLANELAGLPGRVPDAMAHYETALRLQPDFPEVHNNLALALAGLPGRVAEALAHFEAALRLNPADHEAHYNLAATLEKLPGRAPEAIAHYEAVIRLKPDLMDAHYNLAVQLAKLSGRLPDAIAHYQSALRLQPAFAPAENALGLALFQSGRTDEALAHFEAAVSLDPAFADARRNLEQVKALRGK